MIMMMVMKYEKIMNTRGIKPSKRLGPCRVIVLKKMHRAPKGWMGTWIDNEPYYIRTLLPLDSRKSLYKRDSSTTEAGK